MDWVASRLAQRSRNQQRQRELQEAMRAIWPELHRACSEAVAYYNENPRREQPEIVAKLKAHDNFIFARIDYSHPPEPRELDSVKVSVDFKQATVFINRGEVSPLPSFTVQFKEDGASFSLMCDGRAVELTEAAERILDYLLFPDLLQRFPTAAKS